MHALARPVDAPLGAKGAHSPQLAQRGLLFKLNFSCKRTCWSATAMPPLRALTSTGLTTLSSHATTDGLDAAALLRTSEEVTRKLRHLKHSSLHSTAHHTTP